MAPPAFLRPTTRPNVMNLLEGAGFDVSEWHKVKGGSPAANPKFCYNWSFQYGDEMFAVCLWWRDFTEKGGVVQHRELPRDLGRLPNDPQTSTWKRRRRWMVDHIRRAYEQRLPVSVIVVDGKDMTGLSVAAKVDARMMDTVPWAVMEFDHNGGWLLQRGGVQPASAFGAPDYEASFFEGEERSKFLRHRRREGQLRREKIAKAKAANGGKLICEVVGCEFDFGARYGALGEGYAQVHHLIPLAKAPPEGRKILLKDLAIVCANCHAMIHWGGECRELSEVSPIAALKH